MNNDLAEIPNLYCQNITREDSTTGSNGTYYVCDLETGYPLSIIITTRSVYIDYIWINEYGLNYMICRNKTDNSLYNGELNFIIMKYYDEK